ncbi:metal-dependent hydrolase [Methanofollis formosanus]|uniref:Metal-dependent hydrolase n=1 Tax=Methanofollis formosanus TaxID=299308 RepID=A0A8G1A2M4_9EURY|nr:metal-dependent hydrolase [Methanofollis formosanus]
MGGDAVKGDEHISISLATAATVLAPLLFTIPPEWAVAALFGVFIGALAPDADANDSAIFHTRMPGKHRRRVYFLPFFGYGIKYLVYYPISLPFILLLGERGMPRHRGALHSGIGVFLMTLVVGFYAWLIGTAVLGFPWNETVQAFLFGLFGGAVCHLLEDSCTKSGVAWLFPFSEHRTRGRIVTGNDDRRPTAYVLVMGVGAAGIFAACAMGMVPAEFVPWSGAALAVALWGVFLIVSRFGW